MDTTTLERVESIADSTMQSIREAADSEGILDMLENALHIVPMYGRDDTLLRVEVLLGFGGPNVWAYFDLAYDNVQVEVGWGSEVARRTWADSDSVWSDTLSEILYKGH